MLTPHIEACYSEGLLSWQTQVGRTEPKSGYLIIEAKFQVLVFSLVTMFMIQSLHDGFNGRMTCQSAICGHPQLPVRMFKHASDAGLQPAIYARQQLRSKDICLPTSHVTQNIVWASAWKLNGSLYATYGAKTYRLFSSFKMSLNCICCRAGGGLGQHSGSCLQAIFALSQCCYGINLAD